VSATDEATADEGAADDGIDARLRIFADALDGLAGIFADEMQNVSDAPAILSNIAQQITSDLAALLSGRRCRSRKTLTASRRFTTQPSIAPSFS
jgi:hypothetical protein